MANGSLWPRPAKRQDSDRPADALASVRGRPTTRPRPAAAVSVRKRPSDKRDRPEALAASVEPAPSVVEARRPGRRRRPSWAGSGGSTVAGGARPGRPASGRASPGGAASAASSGTGGADLQPEAAARLAQRRDRQPLPALEPRGRVASQRPRSESTGCEHCDAQLGQLLDQPVGALAFGRAAQHPRAARRARRARQRSHLGASPARPPRARAASASAPRPSVGGRPRRRRRARQTRGDVVALVARTARASRPAPRALGHAHERRARRQPANASFTRSNSGLARPRRLEALAAPSSSSSLLARRR